MNMSSFYCKLLYLRTIQRCLDSWWICLLSVINVVSKCLNWVDPLSTIISDSDICIICSSRILLLCDTERASVKESDFAQLIFNIYMKKKNKINKKPYMQNLIVFLFLIFTVRNQSNVWVYVSYIHITHIFGTSSQMGLSGNFFCRAINLYRISQLHVFDIIKVDFKSRSRGPFV